MNVIKYHIIPQTFFDGKMLVTEKIHGTNIGIGFVNGLFRIQARKQIIKEDSNEFGIQKILNRLKEKIIQLHNILQCDFLVYGEIFGKTLPCMKYDDTESKRVWGNNEVFFRAFDIYKVEKDIFMKYSEAMELFKNIEFPYIPVLDVTYITIKDLVKKAEIYKSAYSKYPVEGFVLKKDEEESMNHRSIFKVKRKLFDGKSPPFNNFKPDDYVNDNRFVSAYSKMGNNFEMIKKEMINDTLQDIMTLLQEKVEIMVENYLESYDEKLKKLTGSSIVKENDEPVRE